MATWDTRTFVVFRTTHNCLGCVEEYIGKHTKGRAITFNDSLHTPVITMEIQSAVVDSTHYEGGKARLCERHRDE